jgi:hypothetical protein
MEDQSPGMLDPLNLIVQIFGCENKKDFGVVPVDQSLKRYESNKKGMILRRFERNQELFKSVCILSHE